MRACSSNILSRPGDFAWPVLGKIEGGDDIAVRHTFKAKPDSSLCPRPNLCVHEHGHHLVYRRLDLLIVPSRLRHDLGELTQIRGNSPSASGIGGRSLWLQM
jgi:hypothetical protein